MLRTASRLEAASLRASPRPAPDPQARLAERLHALGHAPDFLTAEAAETLLAHAGTSIAAMRVALASALFLAGTEEAPRIERSHIERAILSLGAKLPSQSTLPVQAETAPRAPQARPKAVRKLPPFLGPLLGGVTGLVAVLLALTFRHPTRPGEPAAPGIATTIVAPSQPPASLTAHPFPPITPSAEAPAPASPVGGARVAPLTALAGQQPNDVAPAGHPPEYHAGPPAPQASAPATPPIIPSAVNPAAPPAKLAMRETAPLPPQAAPPSARPNAAPADPTPVMDRGSSAAPKPAKIAAPPLSARQAPPDARKPAEPLTVSTSIVLRYRQDDSQAPDKLAFLTTRLRHAGFSRVFSYPLGAYSRAVAVDYFFPQDRDAALAVIAALGVDSPYHGSAASGRAARLVVRADGGHRHPPGTIEAVIP